MYIGEICRYLLNQPKVAEETQHSLQLMIGNGLSSEVWKKLQERFRINNIVEVYGSTEGNIAVGKKILCTKILADAYYRSCAEQLLFFLNFISLHFIKKIKIKINFYIGFDQTCKRNILQYIFF